jgi:pectate lyase
MAGIALMGSLAACTVVTDPDYIGLYYNQGSSDGNEFDHCTKPGTTESDWNDEIVMLPTSSMRWTIDDAAGANSNELIVVSTKPTSEQPSGVQVKVSSQTSFVLNT